MENMDVVENYTSCYMVLQNLWKNNKKKEFEQVLQMNLSCAPNPFKLALVCIKLCPDLFKSKNNGMAVAVALELQSFLGKQEKCYLGCLKKEMQVDVFNLAVRQKNTGMMRVLTKVYQLGDVREQFIPTLHAMIVEQHYKEVCTLATLLDLQEHFPTQELIVPLFCQDRLCLADEFLASSPKHQKELVIFIDSVIGREREASLILEKFNITDIGRFKSSKVLCNVLGRLLKRFQLDMSLCPHLYKRRSVGGLRYLFYKYYIEKGLQTTAFHSLVEDAVKETPDLKYTLVDLFCEYCDPQSALPYIHKYQMKSENLPQSIRDVMLACPSLDQINSCQNAVKIASEECWDEDEISYPLSICQGNIVLIDSVEEFEKCMIDVSKSPVLGLDSEWKPTFGIGAGEQVSLMQIATATHVYLVDIMSLQPLLDNSHWSQLGNIFTDANITKLGYGIKSDFKILAKLHNDLKKSLTTPKNIIDFDQKKTALLELLPDIFSFNISAYKGLSDLVYRCFGKPLNKSEQFSNWANRPLSRSQKLYAAVDAVCLMDIYNYLNAKSQELGCSNWQNLKVGTPQSNPKSAKKSKKKEPSPDKTVVQRRQGPIVAKDFHVVCDTMLQGLAKKLRLCGIDAVALENGQTSDDCIEFYEKERRYVLSRGTAYRRLVKYIPAEYICHVESEGAREQLKEVMKSFKVQMAPDDFLSRCVKCNTNSYIYISSAVIRDLQKSTGSAQGDHWIDCKGGQINLGSGCTDDGVKIAFSKIATAVIDKIEMFYVCRKCGKCYWDGEHENGSFRDVVQEFIVPEGMIVNCVGLSSVEDEAAESVYDLGKQLNILCVEDLDSGQICFNRQYCL
ncbi:exonuclease mut-7 homolog isoform X2 [Macrobrachium nipponense]|uniref:exonuclease mut-7 homolog isoform X2 n=1 Tax=Macrobrachium nipponense TaxID=159736 RepID=UPI0030C8066E